MASIGSSVSLRSITRGGIFNGKKQKTGAVNGYRRKRSYPLAIPQYIQSMPLIGWVPEYFLSPLDGSPGPIPGRKRIWPAPWLPPGEQVTAQRKRGLPTGPARKSGSIDDHLRGHDRFYRKCCVAIGRSSIMKRVGFSRISHPNSSNSGGSNAQRIRSTRQGSL